MNYDPLIVLPDAIHVIFSISVPLLDKIVTYVKVTQNTGKLKDSQKFNVEDYVVLCCKAEKKLQRKPDSKGVLALIKDESMAVGLVYL